MIQKISQLVISLTILMANCHDNYSLKSFKEASDNLKEFINEYFFEKNISFFPKKNIHYLENNLTQITIYINEPTKLSPLLAFNYYNQLTRSYFYDYNLDAYEMELIPYEIRIKYKNIYFGLSITIKGLRNDNISLKTTTAIIILTNYTPWVKENIKCKEKK